jgi:hypothetical protein
MILKSLLVSKDAHLDHLLHKTQTNALSAIWITAELASLMVLAQHVDQDMPYKVENAQGIAHQAHISMINLPSHHAVFVP